MERARLKQLVWTTAQQLHLRPELVWAIIQVESSYRTNAYRFEPAFFRRYLAKKEPYKGADPERVSSSYGLVQIMYSTACDHGYVGYPEQLYVPEINRLYGCRHLASLIASGRGEDAAICTYKGGWLGNKRAPFRNQTYLDKVRTAEHS